MLPRVVLARKLGEPQCFYALVGEASPTTKAPKLKESLRDLLYDLI